MCDIGLEHGQSHFHYGPDLPFEEELFIDALDPTNGMRDTDGDGMPDYKEVHYEDFYPFIVNWANDQHRQNPEDFNATEYLKNQFNPFVRENIPPMLLSMSVTTVTEDVYTWVGCCGVGVNIWTGWNTYADIRARIYDVGGLSSVKISGPGGTVTFSSLHNGWYNTTIDVGFWEAATEYTIKLDAKDNAGNELTYDYTVKGLFAGVLDFIKDIWDAVAGALNKAWEAVKSAVDFIVDFVVNLVKKMINMALSPVVDAISGWMREFAEIIQQHFIMYRINASSHDSNHILASAHNSETDGYDPNVGLTGDAEAFSAIIRFIMWPVYALSAIVYAMYAIEAVVKAFTGGAEQVAGMLGGTIAKVVLASVVGVGISLATIGAISLSVDYVFSFLGLGESLSIGHEVTEIFAQLIYWLVEHGKLVPSMVFALLGLIFSMVAESTGSGLALLVADIISLISVLYSGYTLIKGSNFEKALKEFFPITDLLNSLITISSFALVPLEILSHKDLYFQEG